MMDRGRTIGDLMRDRWWQHLLFPEPAPAVRPAPLLPAWGSIPAPASRFGRETRARLEAALLADDQHTMRWAHAIAQRLHPAERELAVEAVVRLWHRHQQEHSRPLLDGDRRLPHRAYPYTSRQPAHGGDDRNARRGGDPSLRPLPLRAGRAAFPARRRTAPLHRCDTEAMRRYPCRAPAAPFPPTPPPPRRPPPPP